MIVILYLVKGGHISACAYINKTWFSCVKKNKVPSKRMKADFIPVPLKDAMLTSTFTV